MFHQLEFGPGGPLDFQYMTFVRKSWSGKAWRVSNNRTERRKDAKTQRHKDAKTQKRQKDMTFVRMSAWGKAWRVSNNRTDPSSPLQSAASISPHHYMSDQSDLHLFSTFFLWILYLVFQGSPCSEYHLRIMFDHMSLSKYTSPKSKPLILRIDFSVKK